MAFVGVEFSDEGGLAIVSSKWLTPRKREVFWPPFKNQALYEKALKKGDTPDEQSWKTYNISRCFFETDDYTAATKKIKRAEITSDLQSEVEDGPPQSKRICRPPRRLALDDSESDEDVSISVLQRPPKIRVSLTRPEQQSKNLLNNTNSSEKSVSSNVLHPLNDICLPSTSTASTTHISASSESTSKPGEDDFLKKILSCMAYLKEQNNQILKLLQNTQTNVLSTTFQLPEDLPTDFPLKNASDVIKIEQYLSRKENLTAVYSYFSTLGGRDITSKTNTILKNLMTNTLATEFSFLGTLNEKKAFSELHLKTVVLRAVQSISPNTLENEINDSIKTWLKHAPQRARKDQTKNSKTQ